MLLTPPAYLGWAPPQVDTDAKRTVLLEAGARWDAPGTWSPGLGLLHPHTPLPVLERYGTLALEREAAAGAPVVRRLIESWPAKDAEGERHAWFGRALAQAVAAGDRQPTNKDGDDLPALFHAVQRGIADDAILMLFGRDPAALSRPLAALIRFHGRVRLRNLNTAPVLLETESPVATAPPSGWRWLFENHPDWARRFHALGADLDVPDALGETDRAWGLRCGNETVKAWLTALELDRTVPDAGHAPARRRM